MVSEDYSGGGEGAVFGAKDTVGLLVGVGLAIFKVLTHEK